jgi:hypothetical protein
MPALISKDHEVALTFQQQNKSLMSYNKSLGRTSNILHNQTSHVLQIEQKEGKRVLLTDSFWDRRVVSMCRASNLTAV